MKRKFMIWFALMCCGLDFIKDHFSERKRKQFHEHNYQLDHPLMYVNPADGKGSPWERVAKNPWSLFHHWVNLPTEWAQIAQEIPMKVCGFFLLLTTIGLIASTAGFVWAMITMLSWRG